MFDTMYVFEFYTTRQHEFLLKWQFLEYKSEKKYWAVVVAVWCGVNGVRCDMMHCKRNINACTSWEVFLHCHRKIGFHTKGEFSFAMLTFWLKKDKVNLSAKTHNRAVCWAANFFGVLLFLLTSSNCNPVLTFTHVLKIQKVTCLHF